MLLPAVAVKEPQTYNDICVVPTVPTDSDCNTHSASSTGGNCCGTVTVGDSHNTAGAAVAQGSSAMDDLLDSVSIDSEDDLDQDCEVKDTDVAPVEIVDPNNLDLQIKEQHDDQSLAQF